MNAHPSGLLDCPSKIVCVGRNYVEHAKELGTVVPECPLLFLKPPSALIGDGAAIVLPAESRQVEHEAEIGVVMRRRLSRGSEAEALDAVAGITCVNDVTARDLQKTDGQWTRAKGFDTFCPAGPRVVPLDELPPLGRLEVVCRVNGEERQRGGASLMVFPVPRLLAYISGIMTLEPGDVIATGTPAGVGPLTAGDVVEVEIPGVGVLRNPVVAHVG
jgi:2-keto-4-pentenoate hydratase/2-oxohepta-3-ene-1,7-dioic acid hydratase in catechol pathway